MRNTLVCSGIVLFLSVFSMLPGQTESDTSVLISPVPDKLKQLTVSADVEIAELVFDETITKIGRDFYYEFFNKWENPTTIKSFSIAVKERPMPGLGTQVRVEINDNQIFIRFLQPKQELIEIMSEYAVQLCQQYLINYQDIQEQLKSEDQLGSGIF